MRLDLDELCPTQLLRLFSLDPRGLVPQVNQVDSYHNCYLSYAPFRRLAAGDDETTEEGWSS